MSNKLESTYDEQLLTLKNLKWLPWVGKHYAQNSNENKILLIGESHYLGDKPDAEKEYEKRNMTRLIVKDMGVDGNKYGSDFFINTYKLLLTDKEFDNAGRRRLWDNVVFYNFVQTPMRNKKTRPKKQEMVDARSNFMDLLTIFKPTVCIFLGLKAELGLNETIEKLGYKLIKPISWKDRINGCYGRYGRIESPDGNMIKLVFVRHPSQYFTYGLWNNFLQKYIIDQLNWLKQIS